MRRFSESNVQPKTFDRGSLTETRLSVLSYAWIQVWLDAPMNFRSRPSSSNTAVWESCSVPPESLIRRAVAFPSLSRSYSTQAPLLSWTCDGRHHRCIVGTPHWNG